jgi:hypothetical protein
MAGNLVRYGIDGYGQIELNQVAFRRDGRIEAQCKLKTYNASTATDGFDAAHPAENGMLLAVDNVKREIACPVANETRPIALHYSTEHMYDERKSGLKNFCLYPEQNKIGFESYVYPRLGYLSVGDKFNTNCLCYDDSEFDDDEDVDDALEAVETTPVYGGISTLGAIKLSNTKPSVGPVLVARWADTMPDGQKSVAFICVQA